MKEDKFINMRLFHNFILLIQIENYLFNYFKNVIIFPKSWKSFMGLVFALSDISIIIL